MNLNHINLIVSNVAEAVNFFETYFDFHCSLVKGDNMIAVLHGEDNFVLVLMGANKNENDVAYPPNFHIGFMMKTKDEVEDAYNKLKDGSIDVCRAPGKIRDSYGFYFYFQGIMIEVGHYEM